MGISFRTRSFILGLTVASITWGIIIYLYFTLVQSGINEQLVSIPTIKNEENEYFPFKPKNHDLQLPMQKPFKRSPFNSINDIFYGNKVKESSVELHGNKIEDKINPWNNALSKNEIPGDGNSEAESLARLGLVMTIQDQKEKDEGYRQHAFNTMISSRLSLHRSIPDTRHEKCKSLKYSHNLPSASIIICFYREAISTLLRSIHSILDRSPSHILKEIILVDDTDEAAYHLSVKGNVSGISDKIVLTKSPLREGLIRARIYGARQATGQALVFLDSHIEVNKGWLEPLLNRINEKNTNVATPIIDVISSDTFKYTASSLVRGGFNWGLHFKWDSIPINYFADKSNFVKPIKSPTMAGGLFAIDAKYFRMLGEYDSGMDIWGGENLELSFRIWMCGGTLEIIPCSRVGHVFRKRRPYGDAAGEDSLLKNSLRLAHVWLGEYIEKFFDVRPEAREQKYGDISDRLQLKKSLGCKDFKWYIENVYPNIMNKSLSVSDALPPNGKKFERWDKRQRNYLSKWQLQLSGTVLCVESEEEPNRKGTRLILSECAPLPRQIFYQTDKNELILAKLLCLEASNKVPKMGKCHDMGGNQEWKFNRESNVALYNIATGLCLAATESRSGSYVDMALCSTPTLASWNLVEVAT